jgi:hypothetical protein
MVCLLFEVILLIDRRLLAVIKAWDMPYHGDGHKVLLQAVDEVYGVAPEMQYARILPIAQSSGTGKSKTVDRASQERILLPLCLREDLGEKYFGACCLLAYVPSN